MKAIVIEMSDLDARAAELIQLIREGKPVLITDNLAPRAFIQPVPVSDKPPRTLGEFAGKGGWMAEDFDAYLGDDFEPERP